MRYCVHCGKIIDEFDFFRDNFNCPVCGAMFLEDDMTALKYAELTEEEKDAYDEQLLDIIKNNPGFDERDFEMHCSMRDGEFWEGFRPDKYLQIHKFSKEEYRHDYINYRKENEPFKSFPPIDKEKAREEAHSAVEWERHLDNRLKESNVPRCPTCSSTSVEKISLGKKAFGGAMFGIFSSNVRNTFHCKNCGYKW